MEKLDMLRESLSEQDWHELVWITLSTGMTLEEINEFFAKPFGT
ncbi:hypothetical protein [Metabacillus fastidiosus]